MEDSGTENAEKKIDSMVGVRSSLMHRDSIVMSLRSRDELSRWLEKSRDIQWDYAHILTRKGKL